MVISRTRSIYLLSKSARYVSAFNSSPVCYRPRKYIRSFASSNTSNDASSNNNNDTQQLRIAVVGGGAAGMTAALHLSPLVSAGLIHTVDIYESTQTQKNKADLTQHRNSGHEDDTAPGKQLYPGSGALGRNIGVGIWSTAWWPFLRSLQQGITSTKDISRQKNRQSFKTLLQDLESCGSYTSDVGYRTPNGSWLVKSELNSHPFGINDLLNNDNKEESSKSLEEAIDNPALLFVRERDLLSCLRNAIKIEQRLGTVKYHSGIRVNGIDNINGELGSLVLQHTDDIENESLSWMSPQYHLIIAADGLYSSLRSRFAGHNSAHVTAGMTLGDPQNMIESEWDHTKGQREATQVEDREYVVFRGNALKLDSDEEDGSGSFQTWGENRNMRFAAVPFNHETEDLEDDEDDTTNTGGHYYSKSQSFKSKQQDEEVWFATMSDPSFVHKANAAATSHDAEERKQMLLEAFGKWHKPISTLIRNTPADEIMYEIAIAHRHNTQPVFDVARIMEFELLQDKMAQAREDGKDLKNLNSDDVKINGQGPTLVFLGDAQMAIDPVLAQGFTMAMEAGASLAQSIEVTLTQAPTDGASSSGTPHYQPELLQQQLLQRHYSRERRLLQLLRSTELVQVLAQPSGFGATIATWFIRPVVMLCPEILKKKVFDYMLRYSLGLTGNKNEADR